MEKTMHRRRRSLAAALGAHALVLGFAACYEAPADVQWDAQTAFVLTVTVNGPGSVSSSPGDLSCAPGTCTANIDAGGTVVLTAEPDSDALFVGFSGACTGSDSGCSLVMTEDLTVEAAFVAQDCEPNVVSCTAAVLNECDADGVSHPQTCLFGCHPSGTRCYDLNPSNAGIAACLDAAAFAPDASIPDGATIDTDSGSITLVGGGTVSVASDVIAAPTDGVAIRCFKTNDVEIGDVNIVGSRGFALAANGAVTISGRLSASASGANAPGPGSYASCGGSDSTNASFGNAGGGGGGGFGTTGGRGGNAQSSNGGSAGPVNGNPELVPLRGGCRGGRPGTGVAWNNAGGAIQIASRDGVTIGAGSGVTAAGWGGGDGLEIYTRGGGSGGAILIEAPFVATAATSFIAANGGGGGGMTEGSVGTDSLDRAAGGAGGTNALGTFGAGGLGGAMDLNGGFGALVTTGYGGGGGGGVGRIRINAYDVFVPATGAAVSPTPSSGSPGLR